MKTEILFGKKAFIDRLNRINELHLVLKGNRGWKKAFFKRYTHLDTGEGGKMLIDVSRKKCDDAEILKCLEDFIPYIKKNKPEWFKK